MPIDRNYTIPPAAVEQAVETGKWRNKYPNPADFNFDYKKLLESGPVAKGDYTKKVAVVGGGIAGVCAARELLRSGFKVDLFEATGRLGGRHWSRPIGTDDDGNSQQLTRFEMGAMRMPEFAGNSLFSYYTDQFGITTEAFPNPGYHTTDLGIYLEEGTFKANTGDPAVNKPRMLVWTRGATEAPSSRLQAVGKKWTDFAHHATARIKDIYGTAEWPHFWEAFVAYYDSLSFGDFTLDPSAGQGWGTKSGETKITFGGLGMTPEESALFYTVGGGDGSWGAFYDICSLYPLRTFLFGYGNNLRLVQGKFTEYQGEDNQSRWAYNPEGIPKGRITDSTGEPFDKRPDLLGVESLWQSMYFQPFDMGEPQPALRQRSMHDLATTKADRIFSLYLHSKVDRVIKRPDGPIDITCQPLVGDERPNASAKDNGGTDYDAVVVTSTGWSMQHNTTYEGFGSQALPHDVTQSLYEQHYETSCKVFVALKDRYWEDTAHGTNTIPQLMVSDTFIHDIYGYALNEVDSDDGPANDPGALLLSYTWEDDATKFIDYATSPYLRDPRGDALLVQKCLNELDRILKRCDLGKLGNRGILPYVNWVPDSDPKVLAEKNKGSFAVVHWETHPTIKTAASLYRTHSKHQNFLQLSYNQTHSKASGLYFAGEGFSVDGGWTEPALRSAIDAIFYIAKNSKVATTVTDLERWYPRWDVRSEIAM